MLHSQTQIAGSEGGQIEMGLGGLSLPQTEWDVGQGDHSLDAQLVTCRRLPDHLLWKTPF